MRAGRFTPSAYAIVCRWRSQSWFAATAALGGYLLIYGSWQLAHWGPRSSQQLIADCFLIPIDATAVWLAWSASRRVDGVPRLRRAWRLLSLGIFAFLLGDITYAIYDAIGIAPYPSIADGFYLAFYPLMLIGLLSFPVFRRSRTDMRALWMDSLVVAIACCSVVVYLTLGPNLQASGHPLQKIFSIAYPVGDMVLLVGLSAAVLHGSGTSTRLPLRLVGAALGFFVAADLIYGYQALHSGYVGGDPVDTLWMVSLAIFAIAATTQQRLDEPERIETGHDRVGLLPFLAAALGFGGLLLAQRNDTLYPELTMTAVAIALAALLAARLYLGQRDLLASEGSLRHQALHDGLTGLANRDLLFDRLEQALARSRRDGSQVAVLLIDLDDFMLVNNSLGHAAGDQLLVALGDRLQRITRAGETIARLGGDEYVLAGAGSFDDYEIAALANRVMAELNEPFAIAGMRRKVSGSVGIAVANADARTTPIELLRDADTAMSRAKTSGKGRFEVFDGELRDQLLRRVGLGVALEQALRTHELEVVYQPIVSIKNGRVIATEALARWTDERWGQVSPGEFIPLAEQNGLVVPLGRYLLEEAARQLATWRSQTPAALPLGMFVNISPRELQEPGFATAVLAALDEHGLKSSDLALELTERVFMDEHDPILNANLATLIAEPLRLVLDDFGTGYSGLSSLKRFPLAAVKIDRYFIDAIRSPGTSAPITEAVIGLGHTLGMSVIAEGVETQTQLDHLRDLGCDAAQGFLLARPQTASEITELISSEDAAMSTRVAVA